MVECAKDYNPIETQVIGPNGRVLAYLLDESIAKTFHIPRYNSTVYKTKKEMLAMYNNISESCVEIINNSCMLKPRRHHSKMPKKLVRTNFNEECGDLVILLN